jgi:tetratricopeptide (TPR) repeat protein
MTKYILVILFISAITLIASPKLESEIELAQRLILLGRYEEAEQSLETLYEKNSSDFRVFTALKETYFTLGRNDKLLSLMEKRISQEPNNAMNYIELGKIHLLSNNVTETKKLFKKAFEINPKTEIYYDRAYSEFIQKGFTVEAREMLLLGRKNIGDNKVFSMQMAQTYEIASNFDKSMEEYGNYLLTFLTDSMKLNADST